MFKLSKILIFTLLFSFLVFSQTYAQLSLTLSTDKNTFQLGEPLFVSVELKNKGNSSMDVIKFLEPDYQFTRYTVIKPDGNQIFYGPITILNVRQNLTMSLAPGESHFENAKIFFGNKGWVFDTPGTYKITATHTSLDGNHINSNELTVEIQSASDEAHRNAADLMLTSEAGLFLLWEGGDQFKDGIASLEKVASELSGTIHATYANFALGMNLSQNQGERKAELDKASTYLEQAQRLSKEKTSTDYLRSKTLMRLNDIYEKEGKMEKRDEVLRMFREEFKDKKQYRMELQKIGQK